MAAARNLLATWYEDITFVTIAAAHKPECAFRLIRNGRSLGGCSKTVNPGHRAKPNSSIICKPISTTRHNRGGDGDCTHFRRDREALSDIERITFGDQIVGTTYRADLRHGGCASVSDLELAKIAIVLESHELRLPTLPQPSALAMARLSDLGHRGLVDRDINGLNSDKEKSYRGPFDILPIRAKQPIRPCGVMTRTASGNSFSLPTAKGKSGPVWKMKQTPSGPQRRGYILIEISS